MVWMIQPFSWSNVLWSPVADSLVLGYSNACSFTTDLIITFYWYENFQEISLTLPKAGSLKIFQ